MGGMYDLYKTNAERWEQKEAFDNFFGFAKKYLEVRYDDEFNMEIHKIMDGIWAEQITKPSQFYVTD